MGLTKFVTTGERAQVQNKQGTLFWRKFVLLSFQCVELPIIRPQIALVLVQQQPSILFLLVFIFRHTLGMTGQLAFSECQYHCCTISALFSAPLRSQGIIMMIKYLMLVFLFFANFCG